MEKVLKDIKGITVAGLVVTVIILLILAGVSIGYLFNTDGLFQKVNMAASKYNKAKQDEEDILNSITNQLDKIYGQDPDSNKKEGKLVLSETSGTIEYPNSLRFNILENASGGDLSVSSSDDSIASASIEGTEVTVVSKSVTEDKVAVITVKSAGTEEYNEQTAIFIATIIPGGIQINAVPNVRQYDGTPFDALLSVEVTPKDANVEYSLNGGEYQTRIPQITNVGEYTVTIKASKEGYITNEKSITITVSKQENTVGNLVLSEESGTITYPNTKKFNIIKNISNGELSVKSSDNSIVTASIDTNTNTVTLTPQAINISGQTATITVTSKATNNYEQQTAIYNVTVNQGEIIISATAYNEEYDGKGHDAVYDIVINPEDAIKTYSMDNSSYTTSIPQVTEVGTYLVKIKATKPGYEEKEISKTATVNKVEPTGIWAALEGNTLRFYTTEEKAKANGGKQYGNIKGKTFARDAVKESVDTPWFSDKTSITAAEFADEVAPEYLAYYFSDLPNLQTVNMEKVKTSNVTNMCGLFLNCKKLSSINLKGFDTSNVEDMSWMFLNCQSITSLDVSGFDTRKATTMRNMFYGLSKITTIDLSSFETDNVTDMYGLFANCTNLVSIDLSCLETQNVTSMKNLFYNCPNLEIANFSGVNFTSVEDISGMFSGNTKLKEINFSGANLSNVTDMSQMFFRNTQLKQANFSGANLSNVTDMHQMFQETALTTIDFSNLDVRKVKDMSSIFSGCKQLKTIKFDNINTESLTDMHAMFYQCSALTELDLSSFNTRKVTTMHTLFQECTNLRTVYTGADWVVASDTRNWLVSTSNLKFIKK